MKSDKKKIIFFVLGVVWDDCVLVINYLDLDCKNY